MKRIRVLQITPGIAIGDQSGGAELYALQINRLLSIKEFDPAVFVMTRFGSPAEDEWRSILIAEGITIGGFIRPDTSLTKFFWNVFRNLWKFTSRFRPDIINSHTERGDLLNNIIHLFHPVHPKSVRTVHIDKQWITHPNIGAILSRICFALTINAETAVSATIVEQLDSRGIAQLINKDAVLIHNGIDESYFSSPVRTPANSTMPDGIPDGLPRIGIIGRLTDQKGHTDLLVAFKTVNQKIRSNLLVIGSGPLKSNLQKLSKKLGINDYVYFLGNRNDVMDILPHLDLVVSASLWEGFPTVLLEAMSQEIPVIATDISGSCELIQSGRTGILVPPSNPHILAEAIIQVLCDTHKAEQMGKIARGYASQFTIQNSSRGHAELYKSLITD